MTPAQFIALPEYRAWQAAYGLWLRGHGTADKSAALYTSLAKTFRTIFGLTDNVPVYDLDMVPDGDYTGFDRPWYTWHI